MRTSGVWLRACALMVVVSGMIAIPSTSFAQVEVTGVIGGLLGGDINNLLQGTSSIKSTFDNGPLYGVRVGWVPKWVGFEASFVGSPSGVKITLPNRPTSVDGNVYYLEGNFLVIPIPGPISPFFRVGAGMHRYRLDLAANDVTTRQGENIDKFGWNLGAGLKINIGHVTLRGELVDHITKLGPADFDFSDVAADLGFSNEVNVHNVEISGGIGIRF